MHLLSVDMHQLEPQGVSVVAAISESHLTIHTWPEHGTALIDLFTCGDGADLLDILPDMVKRFGGKIENTKWAFVGRGDANAVDVQKHVMSRQHIEKQRLVKAESPFQKVEIWQISDHEEYLEDETFQARKKFSRGATARTAVANFTKVLFLDDAIEASTADEQVYHEALVHPGMAAIDYEPKRVAIFGSPAGAVLREVLKYKSVEEVVMVERDGEVIKQARKHLPEMSNCSWEGTPGTSFSSCFDSPRATIHNSEVAPWLEEFVSGDICSSRAENGHPHAVSESKKFDVIIMDLFDPELIYDSKHSSRGLYSESFFKQINCALKENGVLITQLGESPFAVDRHSILNSKLDVVDRLAAGFHPSGTFVYNTFVPSFNAEWSFAVACRSRQCANQWYSSAADVNRVLNRRLDPRIQSVGGPVANGKLAFFDGSVMQTMQQTPKGWESLFCAGHNAPAECRWSGDTKFDEDVEGGEAGAAAGAAGSGMGDAAVVRITRTGLERLDALVSKNNSSPEHKTILDWVLRYGKSCDVAGGHVFIPLDQLLEDEAALRNTESGGGGGSGGAGGSGGGGADDDGATRWTPLAQRHLEEYCMGGTSNSKQDMFKWNISGTVLAEAAKRRNL